MSEPFLGEIKLFGWEPAPKGWAQCNGQFLPINQNQPLFALLGTTWGGNGQTTFALPDMRGRTPIHVGSGHELGERGGEQAHTLSIAELPLHTHLVQTSSNAGNTNLPGSNILANSAPNFIYGPTQNLTAANPASISNVGGSQAHLNMQPYLALMFCICLQGVFPSQN